MSQPAERYVRYLDAARQGGIIRELKHDTIAWLALGAGDRVLEIGCGTGDDAIAMGSLVLPRGQVVGVDILPAMVNQARARSIERSLPVALVVADAHALPLRGETFDACRVERSLQHMQDPSIVVDEILRVVKPGGRIVATEPDWETLVIDSPYPELGRAVIWHRIRQARNRDVGRRLYGLFLAADLTDVRVEGRLVPYLTYEEADYFFHGLERAADVAAHDGVVTEEQAREWIRSLKRADTKAQFFFGVTLFTVFGIK